MTHKFKQFNIKVGLLLTLCLMVFMNTGCDEDDPTVSTSVEEMFISSDAANIPLTIKANCGWTANSDAEWLYLSQKSGRGTTDISMMVEALVSDKARTANITVSAENGNKTVIKVTQNGLSETGIRISPKTITIGAKPSQGNAFGVVTQYSDAVVSAEITAGESWIKDLMPTTAIDGYVKNVLYTFSATEHIDAYERVGKITVTVTFANQVHTEEITVIQNGLGAPNISTQERIYMMYNQTSYAQSLWVEDGDQTNVRYECHTSSAQSGTDGQTTPWITGATVTGDGMLELTTLPNSYDEVREGEVMIIAFRGAASVKTSIHVIQSGYKSAGANIPNALLTHDYKAATHQVPLNPINDSKLKVVANNATGGWVKDIKIDEEGVMSYALAAYDGASGSYREATITLEATNGHSNAVYYYVTVRQYAPEAAGICLPTSLMTHSSAAQTGVMPVNANYASKVEVVGVSQRTWLQHVRIFGTDLIYELTQYDGSAGDYREAIITLKATNDHANASYYYVTIRQYAPNAAGMNNTTQIVTFNSDGTTDETIYGEDQITTLPLNAINGSTLVIEDVSEKWVDIEGLDLKSEGNNKNYILSYGVAQFDGREGDMREAVITIKASNGHTNDAYYYIIIRQYAPLAAGISEYPTMVEHDYTANAQLFGGYDWYKLTLNALNSSTIELVSVDNVGYGTDWCLYSENWQIGNPNENEEIREYRFLYRLTEYNGEDGPYRDARFTFKATNSHNNPSYFYVVVRQYAPEYAGMMIDDKRVNLSSEAQIRTLRYTLLNGSEIIDLYKEPILAYGVNADWLNIEQFSEEGNYLEYRVEAYDGANGPFREGYICFVVGNDHINKMIYTVTIRQYAPDAAGISISEETICLSYQDWADQEISYEILNGSSIKSVKVRTNNNAEPNWLTADLDADGKLTYSVTKFAGGQAGDVREGYIDLVVTNSHNNAITYTIPIRQYAPKAAGMSVDTDVYVIPTAGALDFIVKYELLNGSKIDSSDPDLHIQQEFTDSNNPQKFITKLNYFTNTQMRINANAYDGSSGPVRYAYIYVPVQNEHADKVTYRFTFMQYAPDAAGISMPPMFVTHNSTTADGGAGSLPLNVLNGSTVVVQSYTSNIFTNDGAPEVVDGKLTYTLAPFTGKPGSFRESVVTLKATSAHANAATYTVTIRQYAADNTAGLKSDLPSYLGFGSPERIDYTLNYDLLPGSAITNVTFTPGTGTTAWITGFDTTTAGVLTFDVAANTGASAIDYSREGVITITVSNSSAGTSAIYYINVRQYARDMAYADRSSLTFNGTTGSTVTGIGTITLKNVPGQATISVSGRNSTDGNATITNLKLSGNTITMTANWATSTCSCTIYVDIVINAAPYTQYITVPLIVTRS
ncbi:hypothetical protein M2137_000919 [Parabacteroides sp. PFB2-10]|uniref:BACON domain-containing protein n=1 Tax=Parabacteroides sp. PFB2-10 TaxID=1742405 RepID=UPI0024732A75|nr:BACON domain-containing protein [Parabacteroides sp. PFB2-10]MDH6312156.1 hypothetical protein [Parabacteroides sp. PFB2-10]